MIIPTIFVLLSLSGTIYIKYYLNNVPITEFRFLILSNQIVFVLHMAVILPLIIMVFKKKRIEKSKFILLTTLSFLLIVPIISVYILNQFGFSFSVSHILSIPAQKAILGIILLVNGGILFFLLAFNWMLLVNHDWTIYLKAIILELISVLVLMVFSFIYSLEFKSQSMESYENNIGFVLGAAVWSNNQPSPIFKGRIEKAYQLYTEKKLGKIFLTGGNAPGEFSEAEVAYKYLTNLGVKEEDIMYEKETNATSKQILYLKEHWMEFDKYHLVVLISDEFHLTRILEMCTFFNVNAVCVASNYKLNWEKLVYFRVRECIALLLFWLYGI